MKNWKKLMAMLCTAAMITGSALPVWAEADAAEETTEADAGEMTELTWDMLDEPAYEGTWVSFEAGFDLYIPSDWNVLETSEEDQENGVVFQAMSPDDSGVNMVVTANEVENDDYDVDSIVAELTDAGYTDVEPGKVNDLVVVSYETDATYGIMFLDDQGYVYNVQIGPKGEEIQPIAATLFVSLCRTSENPENAADAEAADAEAADAE